MTLSATPRPRPVQIAELSLGIGLALSLAFSAIAFGRLALQSGFDLYSVILNRGLKEAVEVIGQYLATLAVNDMVGRFEVSALAANVAIAMSMAAAVLAPLLFVFVWLRIAKLTSAYLMRGAWALGPRDDVEADVPGALPPIGKVNELLMSEDFQNARLTQEDRAMLGRHGRHTPRAFVALQHSLRLPMQRAIQPLLKGLLWAVMAFVVLVGLVLFLSGRIEVVLATAEQLAANFGRAFGIPSLLLVLALLGIGIISVLMDLRFARALAPRKKPDASKSTEMLRNLTTNATPAQFLSVLKSELAIRLKQARVRTHGTDDSRDGFVDQSSFFVDLLIENESKAAKNPVSGEAQIRIWTGVVFVLAGTIVPLFFLLPSSLQNMLQFDRFELATTSSALIWMSIALATGRAMRELGMRAVNDAEVVLQTDWHETPIAAIRIDGTVNTQTALTGRAQNDSYGAENRIQQSRYDARLVSCTLITVAPKIDAAREIVSFSPHGSDMDLHQCVADLLREEGSNSTFSAVTATMEDNQAILTKAQLHKAELELRLAQTREELRRIEMDSGDIDRRD